MNRGYQYDFSSKSGAMYDVLGRERKARTMVAVLREHFDSPLESLSLLNVGGSTGIIDHYLAEHLGSVTGIDIDAPAIEHARKAYSKENLRFEVGDALDLKFPDETFDVVICSQVYEHVPNPQKMLAEIFRVLRRGGVCYFAASNRLMWNEPHYNLPLLSVIPRRLAHMYVKLAGRADWYYEKHLTYWGLRDIVRHFITHDYTLKILQNPTKYFADYMIKPGTFKATIAVFLVRNFVWLSPGYIWLLEKPDESAADGVG